jgi:DNA end-binding protein Ku
LHFHNEVRDADIYFDDIPKVKIERDMLDLATHILDSKKTHFDPEAFDDRYEKALIAVIKAKKAGKELPEAPEAPRDNVISLMDALKRSVQSERHPSRGRSSRSRANSRRKTSRPAAKRRRMKKAS